MSVWLTDLLERHRPEGMSPCRPCSSHLSEGTQCTQCPLARTVLVPCTGPFSFPKRDGRKERAELHPIPL